jgi:tetratricopeptide (TPR) repeat protein
MLKFSWIFLGVLGSVIPLIGQDYHLIDSLSGASRLTNNRNRVDNFILLAVAYSENNNHTALAYADSAFEFSLFGGDSIQLIKSARLKGQLLRRLDRLDESIGVLTQVVLIAERRDENEYTRILNAIAIVYTFRAEYDLALEYYFKSLAVLDRSHDKLAESNVLNNIGLAYYKLDDFKRAIKYYNKCLELKKSISSLKDMDLILINIGTSYNQVGNFSEGLKYITLGLKICDGGCSKTVQIIGKLGLGITFYESGKLSEARALFNESYAIARVVQDKRAQLDNLINLARISRRLGQREIAEKILNEAEGLATLTHYNQIRIDIYKEFVGLYEACGNFRSEAEYQRKYVSLSDSIYDFQQRAIAKIQSDFEEREYLKTIEAQRQILGLKEEKIKSQYALTFLMSLVAMLFVGLVFILYNANLKKQRINTLLDKKVQERTISLEENLIALRRISEEQNQFLSNIYIDLRAYLATMKGLFIIIQTEPGDAEWIKENLRRLEDTTKNLSLIIYRLNRNNGIE